MPVLSEPPFHDFANLPDLTLIYVFLGASLLVLLGTYISRRKRSPLFLHLPTMASSSSETEKGASLMTPNSNTGSEFQQSASLAVSEAKPRIQNPIQNEKQRPAAPPPPFFTPPMPAPPTEMGMNFASFEPAAIEMPPRRRSYTKMMSDGTEVSGKVIVAEGWRRHTRVYGGGVCKACEESERRLSA